MKKHSSTRGLRSCTALLGVSCALGGVGCVERLLQVRTDPPGCSIYVNGVELQEQVEGDALAATSMLEVPFTYYGTFDVTVRKGKHFAHRELVPVRPPWYEVFPLDLFSEVFIPWTLRDVHTVDIRLQKVSEDSDSEVYREEMKIRAEELQTEFKRQMSTRKS